MLAQRASRGADAHRRSEDRVAFAASGIDDKLRAQLSALKDEYISLALVVLPGADEDAVRELTFGWSVRLLRLDNPSDVAGLAKAVDSMHDRP